MLRTSARHNYSPELPGDAQSGTEGIIPGFGLAENGLNCVKPVHRGDSVPDVTPAAGRVTALSAFPRTGDPGMVTG